MTGQIMESNSLREAEKQDVFPYFRKVYYARNSQKNPIGYLKL